jgi:hypothetical protein
VHYGIFSSGDDLNVLAGDLRIGGGISIDDWTISQNSPGYGLSLYISTTKVGVFDPDNGQYHALSDYRFKKNITNLGNILEKVTQLKPSTYQFNQDKGYTKAIGFIAQDVAQLFPELVEIQEGNGYDDLHLLDYNGFGVLAIKAIQEQQVIIQDQASKITSLEERLSELESKLTR